MKKVASLRGFEDKLQQKSGNHESLDVAVFHF